MPGVFYSMYSTVVKIIDEYIKNYPVNMTFMASSQYL